MRAVDENHLPKFVGASVPAGLVLSVLLLLAAASALAHGGGTPQLTNAVAGPYRIFVWTEPEPWRAGEAHITMAVTLPPPEDAVVDERSMDELLAEPVTDVDVVVRMTPLDAQAEAIEVVAVTQDRLSGAYYEADVELLAAGRWQIDLHVAGPRGEGAAAFEVDALPAQRLSWGWMALGALVVLGAAALFGMRARTPASARAARSRPQVLGNDS